MPYCNYDVLSSSGQNYHESTTNDRSIIMNHRIPPSSPSSLCGSSTCMCCETENESETAVSLGGDFLDEFFDEAALYDVLLSTDFL
jgi:hypothetical protein